MSNIDFNKWGIEDWAKKVRFADDEANKYGFTRKMERIYWDLVYEDKKPEDAEFEMNEFDRAYYEKEKKAQEWLDEQNGGVRKAFVRYIND